MYQPVLTRKNAVAVKYEEPSDGCGAKKPFAAAMVTKGATCYTDKKH